jgi:hypothetical protein
MNWAFHSLVAVLSAVVANASRSSTRSEAAADQRGRWLEAVGLRLPVPRGQTLGGPADTDADAMP